MYAVLNRSFSRDPFAAVDSLLNSVLARNSAYESAQTLRPAIDVVEFDGSYEVRAELPGVAKEDIVIDIRDKQVRLSAKREVKTEREDGGKVIYAERVATAFERSFVLAQEVDQDKAQARFENGVLILNLPKRDAPAVKRLTVQ